MKKKIVFIEDDTILSDRLCGSLREAGFDVVPAFDGEEGLRLVETEKPDLILLDILLPKLDGLTVAKKLNADELTKAIPITILTALDQPKQISEALENGVYEYIIKSDFKIEEIVAKVKERLANS
jgi:DNA-binding response OmpR family regulator